MYPVNIPVNPYKLNLARKVINTCTVLRKICLSVKAQLPPLTRVIASSHLLDPRSQFFFDATLRMRLPSSSSIIIFLLLALLQTCQTFSFSFQSYPPNHSIESSFLSLRLPSSFLSFRSFHFRSSPRDIYPNIFVPRIHVRLIGAVFPPSIALVVFSSYPRSFHIEISPLVVVREETIFLIFSLERFLRNSRDWRFPS